MVYQLVDVALLNVIVCKRNYRGISDGRRPSDLAKDAERFSLVDLSMGFTGKLLIWHRIIFENYNY